jgi:hypothetical protein
MRELKKIKPTPTAMLKTPSIKKNQNKGGTIVSLVQTVGAGN